LRADRPELRFLYLAGTREEIAARLAQRQGHFMPASLLDSQIADLEPLQPDEPGFEVGIAGRPADIVAKTIEILKG
jgi:carbohydrate kinase (thermoresistant glucokinase family)